ncbi:hypothetical protein HMPREF3115_25825 [Burkholderia sp. HMSC10F09]|nr:hypothetical protein HMPREF3115_25825 [Burkholderia sp. HMSC10F09]
MGRLVTLDPQYHVSRNQVISIGIKQFKFSAFEIQLHEIEFSNALFYFANRLRFYFMLRLTLVFH